ncbi:MAG: tRNA pseudouridine synthase A [Proteobacteria bacterium]|nr:tRNA pseudouridine synthase A [Pseudomonadota bacterium]
MLPSEIVSASYHYRLDVAYNGQGFLGFQSQPGGGTIQDHLESALARILPFSPRIIGASRTDAGVSAQEQVCGFVSSIKLAGDMVYRLNAVLPTAIRVCHCYEVPSSFHPIASSISKVYRYRLWIGACCDPFWYPWVWSVPSDFSVQRCTHELASIVGEHDFRALARVDGHKKSYVRRIYAVDVRTQGPLLSVWIHGDGFLRYMVRNIVGSVVALSCKSRSITHQQERGKKATSMVVIMASQDRCQAYSCAPAFPLTLVRCLYTKETLAEVMASQRQGVHPL